MQQNTEILLASQAKIKQVLDHNEAFIDYSQFDPFASHTVTPEGKFFAPDANALIVLTSLLSGTILGIAANWCAGLLRDKVVPPRQADKQEIFIDLILAQPQDIRVRGIEQAKSAVSLKLQQLGFPAVRANKVSAEIVSELVGLLTSSELGLSNATPAPSKNGEVPAMTTVLFLGANASDLTRLRLDREINTIDARLRESEHRSQFDLRQAHAVKVGALQGLLLHHKPTIVHFSGHGSISGIFLEGDDGNARMVDSGALTDLFRLLSKSVNCVVLNSCYSEHQTKTISTHIEYVIGMSDAIGDTAAIAFSAGFYQALGYGESIPRAFEFGCNQIGIEGLKQENRPRILRRAESKNPSSPLP